MNNITFFTNGVNPPLENLIAWLIIGFLAGVVVFLVDRRDIQGGFPATVISGILGALIGGFLSVILFGFPSVGLGRTSLIFSVVGGLIFAFVQRLVTESKRPAEYTTGQGRIAGPVYYSQVYPSRASEEKDVPSSTSSTTREEAAKLSQNSVMAVLQRYLKGVNYPASREDLIRNSIRMGADNKVLYIFEQLEDKTYSSEMEVNTDLTTILQFLGT